MVPAQRQLLAVFGIVIAPLLVGVDGLLDAPHEGLPGPVDAPARTTTVGDAEREVAPSGEPLLAPEVDAEQVLSEVGSRSLEGMSDEGIRRALGLDRERARLLRGKRSRYARHTGEAAPGGDEYRRVRDPQTGLWRYERRDEHAQWREVWPLGEPVRKAPQAGSSWRLDDDWWRLRQPIPGLRWRLHGRALRPDAYAHPLRDDGDLPPVTPRSDHHLGPDPLLALPDATLNLRGLRHFEYDGPWPWELEAEGLPDAAKPPVSEPGAAADSVKSVSGTEVQGGADGVTGDGGLRAD